MNTKKNHSRNSSRSKNSSGGGGGGSGSGSAAEHTGKMPVEGEEDGADQVIDLAAEEDKARRLLEHAARLAVLALSYRTPQTNVEVENELGALRASDSGLWAHCLARSSSDRGNGDYTETEDERAGESQKQRADIGAVGAADGEIWTNGRKAAAFVAERVRFGLDTSSGSSSAAAIFFDSNELIICVGVDRVLKPATVREIRLNETLSPYFIAILPERRFRKSNRISFTPPTTKILPNVPMLCCTLATV